MISFRIWSISMHVKIPKVITKRNRVLSKKKKYIIRDHILFIQKKKIKTAETYRKGVINLYFKIR